MFQKTLIAGYEVEASPKRPAGRDPAHVILHRLGSSERGWLTPDEARELARILCEAADEAARQY